MRKYNFYCYICLVASSIVDPSQELTEVLRGISESMDGRGCAILALQVLPEVLRGISESMDGRGCAILALEVLPKNLIFT